MIAYKIFQGDLVVVEDEQECFSFLPGLQQEEVEGSCIRLFYSMWNDIPELMKEWVPFVVDGLGVKEFIEEKSGEEVLEKEYMTFDMTKVSAPAMVSIWNLLRVMDSRERPNVGLLWDWLDSQSQVARQMTLLARYAYSQLVVMNDTGTRLSWNPQEYHCNLCSSNTEYQVDNIMSWKMRARQFRPMTDSLEYIGSNYIMFGPVSNIGKTLTSLWKDMEAAEGDEAFTSMYRKLINSTRYASSVIGHL